MTRRETIVELARTLTDVQPAAIRGTTNHGRADSVSLEHSTLYRAGSYAHLEAAMIDLHHAHARAHHHFTHRYIHTQARVRPARNASHGVQIHIDQNWRYPGVGPWMIIRTIPNTTGCLTAKVESWPEWVDAHAVNAALDWLDRNLPDRIWLPNWDKLSERAA